MMWRLGPGSGTVEFLITSSENAHLKRVHHYFPGGSNRISRSPLLFRDEKPEVTLAREWAANTGLILGHADKYPLRLDSGGGHFDYFYLLEESYVKSGELRTTSVYTHKGGVHLRIDPPRWIAADWLGKKGKCVLVGNQPKVLERALKAVHSLRAQRGEGQKPAETVA